MFCFHECLRTKQGRRSLFVSHQVLVGTELRTSGGQTSEPTPTPACVFLNLVDSITHQLCEMRHEAPVPVEPSDTVLYPAHASFS